MKKTYLLTILLAISLILSACRSSAEEQGQSDSEIVLTAAAQTADAMLRTMAASTPTIKYVTPSPTRPTDTPTPSASPTAPLGTSTQFVGGFATGTGDKAEFMADLTVPDGTVFEPNATFVKTWRLKNAGTTTWTTAYTVVYQSGDAMNAPASVALPASVPPGQTVDVSVQMTAPAEDGTYTANFLLANAIGQRFGLDPNGSQPFYVVIVVGQGGTPAVLPTATPPAGIGGTPGAGGSIVTWVFLTVDNAVATTCPHTYNFTSQVTLNNPTTITYRLEFLSNNPNQIAPVLDQVTSNLPTGTHNLNFQVNFSSNFNGVARLHVSAPEDVYSNPVNLVLTCPTPVVYPTP